MKVLSDRVALTRAIAAVPRSAEVYSTNFYAAGEQVDRWLAAAPLAASTTPGALLLLRTDRDFHHVYHAAQDMPALVAALSALPPGRYAADLVGQGDELERTCAAYTEAGFAHHAFLARMGRVQAPSDAAGLADDALIASAADVPAVAAFLDRLLDPLTEQLPDMEELAAAAAGGRLLVAYGTAGIDGMLMYDSKGRLAHLRFWHVDPRMHGKGVGRRLMTAFLARCAGMRRIVLWVIGDNDRSIAIYRHYGFTADGLLDRVMTLTKDF